MARAYLKNRLPVPDRATAIAILSHRDSLFEGLGEGEQARKEGRKEGRMISAILKYWRDLRFSPIER